MKLLVLVGPKGSGKDASAKLLEQAKVIPGNISFALPLKRICAEAFDVGAQLFHDVTLKERPFKTPITVNIKHLRAIRDGLVAYVSPHDHFYNINALPASSFLGRQFTTPREILQIIGTDLIRNHTRDDFHCLAAFSTHNLKLIGVSQQKTYAVTDCRFLSEYDYLKANHDCQFFYVERPEAEALLTQASHQSELEVLQVRERLLAEGGTLLLNTGSLQDLAKLLADITPTIKAVEAQIKPSKFKYSKKG